MSEAAESETSRLEDALRRLPDIGVLIKNRPYRQVWRFEHEGKAYFLKFYPRHASDDRLHRVRDKFRRSTRGSPALLEFTRLQTLQKAGIPAPRAVAVLVGFRIKGQRGDAVIIEAIEPSIQLDDYLRDFQQRGEMAPNHRDLARQVRELVHQLTLNKLGHEDLHLGNFVIHEGKVFLIDAYSMRQPMRPRDLFRLAYGARAFATRTDLLRAWRLLAGGPLPRSNPLTREFRNDFLKRIDADNRYFGRLQFGEWSGHCFRSYKYPRYWSAASAIRVTDAYWQAAWPSLLSQLDRDELQILKRTRSGDVLAGTIQLGQNAVKVIIKRPRRRYWYRYIFDLFRRSRSWRSWVKAWNLIARNLPTAWPILVMEKRAGGYITDSISVFEFIDGQNLGKVDLDALSERDRETLFRRAGHVLRTIDELDMAHFDAKSSNWIVRLDEKRGPWPILIDPDAVRFRRLPGKGMRRLLGSMKHHPQYTPSDSLALCLGYAPWSGPQQETESADERIFPSPGIPGEG